MKRVELLAPAGDMESLKSAVHNGADAIYLSGKNYGARKFANNFTLEEIETAIKYCHLYDVAVYITINTIIYEHEIEEVLEYIKTIHEYGVDAVIMQDIGLIKIVREKFPDLEIHASTQAHNHNREGLEFFKSLGVKRVVLARELSLNEIKDLNVDIEKEVFIHGALCVSYSGECLFSSLVLNRSGNRGECAGLCRLPYDLLENDQIIDLKEKYLLSMKELNTTKNIKDILDTGVESLKIEGRMKSPEYVGFVTALYRKLIDKYYNDEEITLDESDLKKLKVLYNREFTKGFLNNEDKNHIVNSRTPNHQGIILGEVLEVGSKIKIKLSEDINQGDGIRFSNNEGMIANFIYNEKGLLISSAKKGEIVYLDNKVALREKGFVLKTLDIKLTEALKKYNEKKIKIDFFVEAYVDKQLTITVKDNKNVIKRSSIVLTSANNRSTTKEEVIEKLSKLGNTPFSINKIKVSLDNNVFIPIKEVNKLRQSLVEEFIKLREGCKKDIVINNYNPKIFRQELTNKISFLVRNEEQLKYLLDKNVDIYTEDYLLYQKYKSSNVYYKTSRINNKLLELNNENILASEIGSVYKYSKSNNLISDIYLNVVNSSNINLLANLNVKRIGLSVELDGYKLEELMRKINNVYNLELLVYGRVELMVMKYCPISYNLGKDKKCGLCKENKKYALKGNSEVYPIITKNCLTKLLHSKIINKLDKILEYKKLGITNFRIDLYDESINEIKVILQKLNKDDKYGI